MPKDVSECEPHSGKGTKGQGADTCSMKVERRLEKATMPESRKVKGRAAYTRDTIP